MSILENGKFMFSFFKFNLLTLIENSIKDSANSFI